MNLDLKRAVFQLAHGGGKSFLRLATAALLLFFAAGATAQHDVSLEKTVDRDSVRAGDTVTWTLRLRNENLTDVSGLQVRDTLLPGLAYIGHSAPAGTSFNIANGIWTVGGALTAGTPELVLTIKTRVEWEGMYMNIAEVVGMSGTDVDSGPDNGELLEDDMDKACVSVPITICSELDDSVRVTLLPMFTGIQWYRDGVLVPASQGGTQDTFYITAAGVYAFTALQNGCPTLTCCPVVVKDSCYDLALRKTLAAGQNGTVNVGDLVQFTLEVFNQGDLPARAFSLIDHVDLDFFAPFSTADNPPGSTTGGAAIPYVWSSSGTNGLVSLNGGLAPGGSVQLPVTLRAAHGGQAANFAEVHSDDGRDQDSQPDSQEQDGSADTYTDNAINNANGDEDDHDGATLTILASGVGDYVWNDADQDGQQDPTENGVPGIIVNLYTNDSTLVATDTTDAGGGYFFPDLPPGEYYVEFEIGTLPPGFGPTLPNTGNDTSDSDGDPASGWTGPISLGPGEVDTTVDFGVFPGEFDLALEKMRSPGQGSMVDIGDDVRYTIKITNEGSLPAYNVDVTDNIPTGLALSPNDPLWTLTASGGATHTFPGPLLPGQSDSVEIILTVLYGASGQQVVNTAEIASATDSDGTVYTDLDSTPDNGEPGEDDIDEEEIELLEHDPTGWVYCDKTGKIITGGTISVMGPSGVLNADVAIVHDGSQGYYEFYAIGAPGVYTLMYNGAFPLSPNCPPSAGPFDPTGLAGPVVLGVDTLDSSHLVDTACAANPYYLSFSLAPGDPVILRNNLPVQCVLIASIVCEDTNHNDLADAGDQPTAGATVNLYDCSDLSAPILTTVTDSLGRYRFDGLEPGSYMVGYVLSPGIRPVSGGAIDANGFSPCITLDWGQCDTSTAICLYTCPDVDAGPDIAHCNSAQSSQLNAAVPYGTGTFTWSPTAGLSSPNIASPIATPPAPTTYTVTFDDGRGCVDSDAVSIGIGNPSPILSYTPWADTTVDCTGPLVPFEAPAFVDGCDPNLNITLDTTVANNPCGRTIVRTWTATNDNGNSTSFTQTVAVVDNTPPVMTASHPFFGQVFHGDTLFADCGQLASLDSLGFATYDFCSATTHDFTESVTYGNCAVDGFLQSRYCGWTATDACGNTDSLYFWVIVTDTVAPQVTVLHPGLAGAQHGDTLHFSCNEVPVLTPLHATATDNCGGSVAVAVTESLLSTGDCTTGGTLLMRCGWEAVDGCGNVGVFYVFIEIVDDEAPVAVQPADTTVACGSVPAPVTPIFTDCDDSLDIEYVQVVDNSVPCAQKLKRLWKATDSCGNATTVAQVVTVVDSTPPQVVFSHPLLAGSVDGDTVVMDCAGPEAFGAADAQAVDACGSATMAFTENGITPGSCATDGFIVVMHCTWTATDACGNTASVTLHIKVVDETPPVFANVPADVTVGCGEPLPPCGSPTASDGCSGVAVSGPFTADVPTANGHDRTCTWTAADACGNVATATATVHVLDNAAPAVSGVPADTLVFLANGDVVPPPATVTASDGCTGLPLPVVFSQAQTPLGAGCDTLVTRTWTVAYGNGQAHVQQQQITVFGFIGASVAAVQPDTCGLALGSATLSPAGYTYSWSNGGAGATLGGLAAGTYFVTATSGGCTGTLTVTVGNVQVPPGVAVSTSPETCAGADGSAQLSPAGLAYAWGDGGTGPVRTGLAAGTYSVTASEGTCTTVLAVTVANGCDCFPAVLDSLVVENAACGQANGSAALHLAGDEAGYGYLWLPGQGTPDAGGSARTGLPAGHYVVLATYQGNNDCVEKFELDIFDDCSRCPAVFVGEAISATAGSSGAVCLPVPYGVAMGHGVSLNGQPYNGSVAACDVANQVGYVFGTLPDSTLEARWEFAGDTFYTLAAGIRGVVSMMNVVDPAGHWQLDAAGGRIASGNVGGNYGGLWVTHLPDGEGWELGPETVKMATGTRLSLPDGLNTLVFYDPGTGCSDTLAVSVNTASGIVADTGAGMQGGVRPGTGAAGAGTVAGEPSHLVGDTLRTRAGRPVTADLLANDVIRQGIARLEVGSGPANGTVLVNADRTVTYRPLIEGSQAVAGVVADGFTYRVCFDDGSRLEVAVVVEVDHGALPGLVPYPNPADRTVSIDMTPLAGLGTEVKICNGLGVVVRAVEVGEAVPGPLRIGLEGLAEGHYALWIFPEGRRPIVRKLVVARS